MFPRLRCWTAPVEAIPGPLAFRRRRRGQPARLERPPRPPRLRLAPAPLCASALHHHRTPVVERHIEVLRQELEPPLPEVEHVWLAREHVLFTLVKPVLDRLAQPLECREDGLGGNEVAVA